MKESEKEILRVIDETTDCTYEDLVGLCLYSPNTIGNALRNLKKANVIETFDIKGRKAKGLRSTHDHSILNSNM